MQLVNGILCVKPFRCMIKYTASGMVLYIYSNASFLSKSWARSCAAGHFVKVDHPTNPNTQTFKTSPINDPVYNSCKILDVVVGSVAEAGIGSTYHIAQDACPIVTTLEELGHLQPTTTLHVDNPSDESYSNETINPKHSKSTGKLYHWVHDCLRQKQVLLYFCPCITNLAD